MASKFEMMEEVIRLSHRRQVLREQLRVTTGKDWDEIFQEFTETGQKIVPIYKKVLDQVSGEKLDQMITTMRGLISF